MKQTLFFCFWLLSYAATAQTTDEQAVRDTERRRFAAQVGKDYAVLEQVLADDLLYTHSTGNSDTKSSYIQALRDGTSKYDGIEVEEQKIRIYGSTAVVNGICSVKAVNNGQPINTRLRYTDVYVRKNGQWQLVTWQSLKVP